MSQSRIVRVLGVLCAFGVLFVAACSPAHEQGSGVESETAAQQVRAYDPSSDLSLDDIRELGMTMAAKRESLSPDFPSPVPVMAGQVTESGSAAGVVFYTVRVGRSQGDAAEWYARTYAIANWQVVEQREVESAGGPAVVFVFAKGDGARSDITVYANGESESLVEGTISIGVPASGA